MIIFKSPQLIILKVTGPSWALMSYDFIVSSTDGTKEVFEWVAELWALKSDRRRHESWLCHGLLLVRYWAVVESNVPTPPQRCLHPNPWTCEEAPLPGKWDSVYVIKERIWKQGDFPGLPGWAQCNHQGPEKMEGGGTQLGKSWNYRSKWRKEGSLQKLEKMVKWLHP